jgi:hypothetical protein
MRLRSEGLFLGLIVSQAAHSVEEWLFRLYDVLPPARFLSGLVSRNLSLGFALVNAGLVSFGLWCYVARVRTHHPQGSFWVWFWVALESANGIGHLLLAAGRGGYFPGVATAPLLLFFSFALAVSRSWRPPRERVQDRDPG